MWPFILPLLITSSAFSCTATDLFPGGTINCATLTISSPITSADIVDKSVPLIVNVSGDVIISSTIDLNGANGSTVGSYFGTTMGGEKGPGGGDGGMWDSLVPSAGATAPYGGGAGFEGNCGGGQVAEAGGGGGGGLASPGIIGVSGVFSSGGGTPGASGPAGQDRPFDFSSNLIYGGQGGGGGNVGCQNASFLDDLPGTGGGGGGAIQIIASGNITITNSGVINVDGGDGGAAVLFNGGTRYGGGGGAGSGGIIWLQSNGQIINNGSLSALGGTGGNATNSDGGAGGNGHIRLEDIDGSIDGTGSETPGASVIIRPIAAPKDPSLKSSISCGQVKVKDTEYVVLYQFLGPLILLIMLFELGIRPFLKRRYYKVT